jgi:hypothetical protein
VDRRSSERGISDPESWSVDPLLSQEC